MKRRSSAHERALLVRTLVSFVLSLAGFSGRACAQDTPELRLQSPEIAPKGFLQFSFQAALGQSYPIAVSDDLNHWTLLTNVLEGRGLILFADSDSANLPRRYYRVGLPPTPIANMSFIPPGSFLMGSSESEAGRDPTEGPQTSVTISRGFWMGKYEVTQQEYVSVMGTNISFYHGSAQLPLDFANWFDATNYCHNLTQQERSAGRLPAGYIYRLPTEAEWEYACRAGSTTPFAVGTGTTFSSTQGNFDGGFPYGAAPTGAYLQKTTVVGSYQSNAWGLYDMHGNVWEWCQDWYGPYPGGEVTDPKGPPTGTAHVLRGGGFTSVGKGCRSAKRDNRSPTYANVIQGFRVVLSAEQ